MSLESAKLFLKKMQEDEDFVKLFFACSDPEDRAAFIKEHRFEFTKDEIDEARQNVEISGGWCCGASCEQDHKQSCRQIPLYGEYIWNT